MLTIKKAKKTQVEDVANIHFMSWGVAYAELLPDEYISQENSLAAKIEMWQKVIAHPNVSVWLAHDSIDGSNQQSVGFIGYFNKGNNYEITTLYVLPNYQHVGVGSKLMSVALKEIFACNPNANLSLWVLETNIAAIGFYKKQGFIASGEKNEDIFEGKKIVDIHMIKVSYKH